MRSKQSQLCRRRQFITTLEEKPGIYEPIALPIKDYNGEAA